MAVKLVCNSHLSPCQLAICHIILLLLLMYFYLGSFEAKQDTFATCLLCGCGLEIAGYVARTIGHYHWSNTNIFLCQIISLTIAPAFVMAGVYYLLTQLIIIHGGAEFTFLRPSYISWIFVCCDVASLFIQAAGGITAAVKLRLFENTKSGTYIMVGGIAFQVFQ